jgi:tripartite-type tricarboxylate transporter receptor subunit TctC
MNRFNKFRPFVGVFLTLAMTATLPTITAQAATSTSVSSLKSFYDGRLLKITVPIRAGATSDITARIIAKYLTKNLGVKVAVENQTAASGLVARNNFYNTAKPDGLEILVEPTGSLMGDWAMGSSGVNYDITKLQYLGALKRGPMVVTTAPKGPYKTIQDMMQSKTELLFASQAPGSLITLSNMAAVEILGINAKIVTGFNGATERALALTRGEVAGAVFNMEFSAIQAKEGQLNIILQIRADRDSNYKDTPCLGDIVKLTDYHQTILAGVIPDTTIAAVPSATPADKVQFLRDVFAAIFADKEFQADLAKVLPPWLGYMSGNETASIASNIAIHKSSFTKAFSELNKKYLK